VNAVPFPTAIARTLTDLLDRDAGVVVLVEGEGAVADALAPRFADRVLALPIADRAALGVAVGLAWGGRKVVVEVAAVGRLAALAEVLAEACRSPEGFPASIVLRVPWGEEGGRIDGPALDLLAAIAGLTVICPRDAGRVAGLLTAAVGAGRPVVVLEPRAALRTTTSEGGTALLDRVEIVREGGHVTLVGFGPGVQVALDAADVLAGRGVEATVVDLVALAPLDVTGLGAVLERTGRLVVVAPEPAHGRRVAQAAVEGAFWSLEAPPVTAPPTVDAVVEAALAALEG
jgi:pyruvate dehydrogenase E1 component beta subunit